MLASASPLDFISGEEIALNSVLRECNKKEFHHIYPKALLKEQNIDDKTINSIANFCILARASNNRISDSQPSKYRALMPEDSETVTSIMNHALCPADIFHDDFNRFLTERCDLLVRTAQQLMA